MRAILLSLVPENLEEHLELNIQRFDSYTKMRTEVVSFLEQKASKVDDGGAQPMDLDFVQGKGKGKPSNTKPLCYYCNKPGHLARDCRLKQSESSNAQKGSKGKSSKGSPKGSSKGTSKGKGKMGAKFSKGTSKGKTGKNHAAEGENQRQKAKKSGTTIGQKINNGPLKMESGKMQVSKVHSVSAVLLQHVWQWSQSHPNRSLSAGRSWSS